jgi:hypothetical protein
MIPAVERWDQGPAKRLDALLHAKGLGHTALAKIIGVDPSTGRTTRCPGVAREAREGRKQRVVGAA